MKKLLLFILLPIAAYTIYFVKDDTPLPILYVADVIPHCYICTNKSLLKDMYYFCSLRVNYYSNTNFIDYKMFYGATLCSNCYIKYLKQRENKR